jgi:peptidoglycan/xylan/chitin deacetylase (PgdA/CDA1 family)
MEGCLRVQGLTMRELIINFHGIGAPHSTVPADERRYWWSLEALTGLLDGVAARPADADPQISLTFDDGNESDASLVMPELLSRGLTARFFVCAGRIGRRNYLDQFMIRDLISSGMVIGSHGMNHVDWCALSDAALHTEIGDARRKLEDLTQQHIKGVAIPFGSYNRRVLNRLKSERLECIFTSDRGIAQRGWRIKPRETMLADMQGLGLLQVLLRTPPAWTRARRGLSRLYKRIR